MEGEGSSSSSPLDLPQTPAQIESRLENTVSPKDAKHEKSSRIELKRYEEQLRTLIPGASSLRRIDLIHSAIDYISDLEETLQARVRKLDSNQTRSPLTFLPGFNIEPPRRSNPIQRPPLSSLLSSVESNVNLEQCENNKIANLNPVPLGNFLEFSELFKNTFSRENVQERSVPQPGFIIDDTEKADISPANVPVVTPSLCINKVSETNNQGSSQSGICVRSHNSLDTDNNSVNNLAKNNRDSGDLINNLDNLSPNEGLNILPRSYNDKRFSIDDHTNETRKSTLMVSSHCRNTCLPCTLDDKLLNTKQPSSSKSMVLEKNMNSLSPSKGNTEMKSSPKLLKSVFQNNPSTDFNHLSGTIPSVSTKSNNSCRRNCQLDNCGCLSKQQNEIIERCHEQLSQAKQHKTRFVHKNDFVSSNTVQFRKTGELSNFNIRTSDLIVNRIECNAALVTSSSPLTDTADSRTIFTDTEYMKQSIIHSNDPAFPNSSCFTDRYETTVPQFQDSIISRENIEHTKPSRENTASAKSYASATSNNGETTSHAKFVNQSSCFGGNEGTTKLPDFDTACSKNAELSDKILDRDISCFSGETKDLEEFVNPDTTESTSEYTSLIKKRRLH